ncbi:hypothetical protein K227x_52210 [Rubripirellula lacrimiformis]|uniref:Uncharacterized protein n=1 Tax=Rubripirellula lacrimiformis TaxID=1930273 RepID=A0A517NI43_9BACT|nr:hypothetical protein K227x_52210 [Rubripirellula lacrimiformis]
MAHAITGYERVDGGGKGSRDLRQMDVLGCFIPALWDACRLQAPSLCVVPLACPDLLAVRGVRAESIVADCPLPTGRLQTSMLVVPPPKQVWRLQSFTRTGGLFHAVVDLHFAWRIAVWWRLSRMRRRCGLDVSRRQSIPVCTTAAFFNNGIPRIHRIVGGRNRTLADERRQSYRIP